MAKIIYLTNSTENREASAIQMTVPDDLTISEYKIVCMRMASAMGYSHNTISNEFGAISNNTSGLNVDISSLFELLSMMNVSGSYEKIKI